MLPLSADLGFFLNNRVLPNNSVVLLSDIGEGRSALYCLTNRTQCCSSASGEIRGRWTLSDGSNASEITTTGLYLMRGYSSIILNRRNGVVLPTGIYTCQVPTDLNTVRSLYIGVYNSATGGEL